MSQEIYYKAFKKGNVSRYDSLFKYHIGLNVHDSPDRVSRASCGSGIHLAKSIDIAKSYVKSWNIIYEAKAGVILGEDNEKVRVTHCFLRRVVETRGAKLTYPIFPSLCDDWIKDHATDITMQDILSQTIEIVTAKHKTSINMNASKKNRKIALAGVMGSR